MSRLLLVLSTLLFAPVAASASDSCLTGASAVPDAADIAALRQHMAAVCPCGAFDASSREQTHAAYLHCVAGVVKDASDGTPAAGVFALRPQCRGEVKRIQRRSDCGFVESENRDPCCRYNIASGALRAGIDFAARCVDTPGTNAFLCAAQHFSADACSAGPAPGCNPICGDDVANGSEDCDGLDDAACPGSCQLDCTCPPAVGTYATIASAAEPANTPGSPGVTVTNPKLLTQFGGGAFSLNNASYTRYRAIGPPSTPDAILILVPGFEGGATSFKLLAENLIPRALADHGLALEVWAYDRRSHQLEDRSGIALAASLLDPQLGLDWLFGGDLGLPLDPALVAGPNRRAVFYDGNADVPFLANWTPLVFSRDINAVVAAADAVVRNHNVFLGGHSAGTGFAARYAATDFDLSGMGPPQPGYANLRGLVLLEGGGGSTGTPLTADSLDRIEAKFDGGLFGAVRDGSARCVDGTTACTIATEAVDCAGQTPPRCTPTTTAYSIVGGLLNPRLLAAAEPVAIQAVHDPDGGQAILQADQGAPGNNAVFQVPDLSTLALLGPTTALGAIGGFVDDDGLVAGFAPFIGTSVGAPGPKIGGRQTWLDVREAPLPASVLPNNGPPPTTLPAGDWGQEKEVTRIDRLITTFFQGGSNFTDWYYPSSGLSVTSAPGLCSGSTCSAGNVGASCSTDSQCGQAINLDSSQLSIGRGRRDIENLTQASAIDVPVICFGATNGLVPVPAGYLPFAQSIGTCLAPSCDGTPRVIDPDSPNPAFPTFGDVAGGFEVHLSEGFSHVDIVTAEDGPDNQVIGPLAAFLARNSQ